MPAPFQGLLRGALVGLGRVGARALSAGVQSALKDFERAGSDAQALTSELRRKWDDLTGDNLSERTRPPGRDIRRDK